MFLAAILPLLFSIALLPRLAHCQISPGELHKSHEFLEGIQNCQKCHDPNQGMASDKCLACHGEIKESLEQGTGMHGKQKYTQCQTCHVEHQGRTYDLVFWSKGMKALDHTLTGYQLEGKHLTLTCRDCHQTKNIVEKQTMLEHKKDLARTFFGLDKKCTACHIDEHRGQLAATCADCHKLETWKPATKFDHIRAKYILAGKHVTVPCDKCHRFAEDNLVAKEKGYTKYTGLKYGECSDCHRDVHEGKLGTTCAKCHEAVGWGVTNNAQFDHSKTKYPLIGKHSQVTCDKCHRSGQSIKGIKFAKCLDCHTDSHKGEFADRPSKGACEECHSVNGYTPVNFAVAQHQLTKYPLQGAHLAVACNLCHSKSTLMAVKSKKLYTFTSTRCQVCHADVHKGTLDKFISADGCELCHKVESWQNVTFDHSRTKYALEGKHTSVPCRPCHNGKDKAIPVAQLKFAESTKTCSACHKDNHHEQFVDTVSVAKFVVLSSACDKCHTSANWKAEKFDHNRDSVYRLEGAHRKVACTGCHKQVVEDGLTFVRYKPLDTKCKTCHGEANMQELRRDL